MIISMEFCGPLSDVLSYELFIFFDPLLQRRAAERASKSKKVGVHYYETANVKNRNLRKKNAS